MPKKGENGAFLGVFRLFCQISCIMEFGKIFLLIPYGIRTYVIFRGFLIFAKLHDYLHKYNQVFPKI